MLRRSFVLLTLALALGPARAPAVTAPDLSARIAVNGYTDDFAPDEVVFGLTAGGLLEEPWDDSAWGQFNDVRQIHVTWDALALYLGVDATIWGNNVILAADVLEGRGLADMTGLNSWRRLFYFIPEFAPDLFCATWNWNTAPRLLLHLYGNTVSDNLPGAQFQAVSTFEDDQPGRAMEFRIPWSTVLQGTTHDTTISVGGQDYPATVLPPGTALHLAAFVTGGPDGVSGPDSAPNNLLGHPVDYLVPVAIDNFAIVPVDPDGDGLADLGASVRPRVTFHDYATPTRHTSWGRIKARYR